MVDLFEKASIQRIKEELMRDAWEAKGATCPCCDQFVKVYRKKLNAIMAFQMIVMLRNNGHEEWVHTSNLTLGMSSPSDFTKLRFWGFIRQKEHEPGDDGKKTSGLWKLTDEGVKFVKKKRMANAAVMIKNNTVMGWDEKQVLIDACLGEKFDYLELMEAAAEAA